MYDLEDGSLRSSFSKALSARAALLFDPENDGENSRVATFMAAYATGGLLPTDEALTAEAIEGQLRDHHMTDLSPEVTDHILEEVLGVFDDTAQKKEFVKLAWQRSADLFDIKNDPAIENCQVSVRLSIVAVMLAQSGKHLSMKSLEEVAVQQNKESRAQHPSLELTQDQMDHLGEELYGLYTRFKGPSP